MIDKDISFDTITSNNDYWICLDNRLGLFTSDKSVYVRIIHKLNPKNPRALREIKEDLLRDLNEFNIIDVEDEKTLQDKVHSYLEKKGYEIKREVPIRERRVDLVVFDWIGIEIKIVDNRAKFLNIVGECHQIINNDLLEYTIAFIYDIEKKYDHLNLTDDKQVKNMFYIIKQ